MAIKEKDKIEIIKQGAGGEFWKLLVDALHDSKDALRKQQESDDLKELPADQYKVENELLKAKIKYLDKLIGLPDTIVQWLQNPDNSQVEFDPYEK